MRLPRELIFDEPDQTPEERVKTSLHAPWTEENVQIAKEAMDADEIKVFNRPAGRYLPRTPPLISSCFLFLRYQLLLLKVVMSFLSVSIKTGP